MALFDLLEVGLRTPDKPALIVDDTVCTYRELAQVSDQWAQALLACGIGRGDAVTLYLGNRKEYLQLYFACYQIGAAASPLSVVHQARADEVAFAVNLTRSRLLITGIEHDYVVKDIKTKAPSIERIFVLDGPEDDGASWTRFVQSVTERLPLPQLLPSDPALVMFTSGSTDRPKGVTHTHRSLEAGARSIIQTQQLESDDVYYLASLMAHASAGFALSLPVLAQGGTLVIPGTFDAARFLETMPELRPTHVCATPTGVRSILAQPGVDQVDWCSLKTFHCGGDTVTHDLQEAFERVTGRGLRQCYGSTECGVLFVSGAGASPKAGSMGWPVAGATVRLADGDGRDVGVGADGELQVKSEAVLAGYWDDPDNTAKAFVDGWFRTGDLVRQDDDGEYFFVGRIKTIIVKGSTNIQPAEVEDAINEHPDVRLCGVIGDPDPTWGQLVHAYVVAADGKSPTAESLRQFVGERLSEIKVPDRWTFLEALPLTSLGKIDRKALAQQAGSGP